MSGLSRPSLQGPWLEKAATFLTLKEGSLLLSAMLTCRSCEGDAPRSSARA
eukprot:CAMPEP_0172041380 /NCGR_PEP_ID=MMETSP1041-20130122/25017_1 /TAXON_ID=464988 /ORGANISM="Hemiselmis andersenii, Strain CCMP439" /LENGTH=50 /DNA_ID=CAMNT_0012699373 /DNA_START=91 /DNA_END=239 /DNA_ORIENTATION=-